VLTPLVQKQVDARAEQAGLSNEEAKKQLLAEKEPSLQFTTPEELGELAVFFCSTRRRTCAGSRGTWTGAWAAQ
jgi:3-hydroxybutyrate dehydrogenase